jgi:aromatic ring-opening dioxygenase LigB subunit
MLVMSAIVPHSPLLAPRIGKEKRAALNATLEAYTEVEERLYAAGIETIVMMSPHAASYPDAFSANVAPEYVGTMKAFGDHETSIRIACDTLLLDRIQKHFRESQPLPFTLSSSDELDYGFTIPLLLLTRNIKNVRLVPLAPSLLDAQTHAEFGKALKDVLQEANSRIAFIASADLSHKLNEHSPAGANVEGPAFDATIRGKLKTMDTDALLSMDPEAVEAAGQCGYRPIMTLAGLLNGTQLHIQELCYESPFGVGYLTALFEPR